MSGSLLAQILRGEAQTPMSFADRIAANPIGTQSTNMQYLSNQSPSFDPLAGFIDGKPWTQTQGVDFRYFVMTWAGGSIILAGGSVTSGNVGTVFVRSNMLTQAVLTTALTSSATLTAAQVITKYLKSTPGGAANANYQLPTGTALEAVFSGIATNDSFEFVITNVSAVAAETCTVTTNTGWTLEGNMVVQSNNASTNWSTGRFIAARTGANTFTLRRIG